MSSDYFTCVYCGKSDVHNVDYPKRENGKCREVAIDEQPVHISSQSPIESAHITLPHGYSVETRHNFPEDLQTGEQKRRHNRRAKNTNSFSKSLYGRR